MKRVLITGATGFIGSHLVKVNLSKGIKSAFWRFLTTRLSATFLRHCDPEPFVLCHPEPPICHPEPPICHPERSEGSHGEECENRATE